MKKEYIFYISGWHDTSEYMSLYDSIKNEFEFIIKGNNATVKLTDEELTIFTLKCGDKFRLAKL